MSTVNFTFNRNDKKYVLNQNGELSEVAVNTPGFEFNADGSYKGTLVEVHSVNEAKASEDLDDTTYWTATRTTIAGDTETDPKGGINSFLLSETAINGSHYFITNSSHRPSVASGETWTSSIFVKKGDGANAPDIVQLTHGSSFGTSQYANFDISVGGDTSGTVTASNNGTAGILYYGNGWYRISWTATSIISGVSNLALVFTNNNSTATRVPSYEGQTDANVFIWGAQLEKSIIATSYIPTTTSAVTRVSDDIFLTGASSYIGQTSGTIYAEIDIERLNTNRSIICVREDADPVVNRIFLGVTSFDKFYYEIVGDDGDTEISFTKPVTTGIHKLIIVYSSGDTRAYLNGDQIGSSSSSLSFGSTLDIIDIGDDGSDKEPNIFDESTEVFDTSEYYYNVSYFLELNSWIRCFALYKRALSDVEAQRLSLL